MSSVPLVDVLIVGGGMAGGFLAAALADTHLSLRVLDAAPASVMPTGVADLRVVALTEASQRMLSNTGIWQRLDPARVASFRHMQVWDADGTGQVCFSAHEVGAEALGWIIENVHLVATLQELSRVRALTQWSNNAAVAALAPDDEGWRVTLADGEELTCRLLVGADGARSQVRAQAGISAVQRDSGHQALVTRLITEKPHGDCARQWFMGGGPLAFLPLFGEGHQVSIVWSCVPDQATALATLSQEGFASALERASEAVLGKVAVAEPVVRFPIHELHAASYVAPYLALLGDAAHVIHPLAGQGINLGLLDAGVLAEEIGQALATGQPFWSAALLHRYQRRRRGHNLVMQQSMRGFQTLFAQQAPALRWLRNAGMQLVNGVDPLKQRIMAEALGRHGDLPALAKRKSAAGVVEQQRN